MIPLLDTPSGSPRVHLMAPHSFPSLLLLLVFVLCSWHLIFLLCCHCLPVVPAALDLWPLLCLLLLFFLCVWLLLLFTCKLARRFSVASPPLQDEEVVAPLGHPQLQSVFQQNFLRFQPHFFQQGGTGGSPPPSRSLLPRYIKLSLSVLRLWDRPDPPYSGGFSGLPMIILRSEKRQVSDFFASGLLLLSRLICSSCTHRPKIVYLWRWLTLHWYSCSFAEWGWFL